MTCILCYFSSSWACVQCKAPYDMDEIEDTLLDAIHRKSMAFILQDLKCVKCNGIKENNMRKYCRCAGDFTNTVPAADLYKTLMTFRGIARHYEMVLLMGTVDWILKMNPQMSNN
eukprot:XP_011412371.2 PREDICTED: DNA polymerase epsilon catalytic subunit A [Crassostrea gigas]